MHATCNIRQWKKYRSGYQKYNGYKLGDAFVPPKSKICAKDHHRERLPAQTADRKDIIDKDISTGVTRMNECMNGCMQRMYEWMHAKN